MQIADALKNLKKYDFIDKLILILMFFYLLIDAVNGLMLRYYSFSISQPYKLLLLFLIILGPVSYTHLDVYKRQYSILTCS